MNSLISMVKKAAPWLASGLKTFGGPGGALAGEALSAIAGAVGASDGSVDAVSKAVASATPEQLAALRKADNDFKERMTALGFQHEEELEKIGAGDRSSAREREKAIRDWTPRILGYTVVLAGLGIIASVLFGWAGKVDSTIAGAVIGYLVSEMKQVLNYYFGSSQGSSDKTSILAEQVAGVKK